MTRHARNCTAGAVYTYHEKKKDAQASGYGTDSLRLGKDSVKDFDCCCLSLQPCNNPVITQDGYLYDKEVIIEYIIKKKNDYSKELKEYEKQKQREKEELSLVSNSENQSSIKKFLSMQKNLSDSSTSNTGSSQSISNMQDGNDKKLPSFWVPSETPMSKSKILVKPDKVVRCPMSGKPIKLKDLIEIHFTEVKEEGKSSIILKNRYKCAVTGDLLSNSVPVAAIKTTGHVVTMECVEKLIKKDWVHPLTGEVLKESDIIPFKRGGTGYAMTNELLNVKSKRPVMQA